MTVLRRKGWTVKKGTRGSHRKLIKGDRTVVFAFGDGEELGPRMLARIGRQTGLKPSDL